MVDFADRQISELSGGQQQRVFLARALIQDADIYFGQAGAGFRFVAVLSHKQNTIK